MYDPQLGRWHIPDPFMEWNFNLTPYHYVRNNPILYIDPFGLQDTTYISPIPIEPVIIKPETKWQKLKRKLNAWWNSGWDPTTGDHYQKKTRKSRFDDDIILKNIDQEEVKNLGEAFGDSRGEPTNRNTVKSDVVTPDELDAAKEMITTDEKIIKQHTGIVAPTTASGRSVKTINMTYIKKSWKGPYRDSLVQYEDKPDSLFRYFYNEDSTRVSTWGPENTVVVRKYKRK